MTGKTKTVESQGCLLFDTGVRKDLIHPAADQGFQIAGDSYERGRPEYPREAVEHLVEVLGCGPGRTVVDLGAGTGKFAKLLVASEARIVAVEPVEGMRKKFSSLLPDLEILDGTAESIPLPDSSVDAVVVAQAFHWFDGSRALTEIHRILKPQGRLGLIWNARDESLDWVAQLTAIMDPYQGSAPRYRSGQWRLAFEDSKQFGPLENKSFQYLQRGSYEMVVDRVASVSFISALPLITRHTVLEEVRRLLAKHPMTAGKSEVELPYRTDVFWCERITKIA